MITRPTPWRAPTGIHAPVPAARRPSAGVLVAGRVGPLERGTRGRRRATVVLLRNCANWRTVAVRPHQPARAGDGRLVRLCGRFGGAGSRRLPRARAVLWPPGSGSSAPPGSGEAAVSWRGGEDSGRLEGPYSSVVRGSSWLLEAGLVVGVMVVGLVGWPSPRVETGRILDGPARQDRLSEEPVFGVQRRQCRISRRRARRGAAAGRWPRRGGPEPQLVRGRAHQRSAAELDRGRDHGGGARRDAVDPGEVFGALVRRLHGVECDLVLLSVVG